MIAKHTVKAGIGLLAATATAVVLTAAASPASASKSGSGGAGHSTLAFSGPVIRTLQSNGCGTLSATALGNATVTTTLKGTVKVRLPITGIVTTSSGAMRIEHAGSGVELSNNCYDITMTGFYIQDLDNGGNTTTFDVLAKNKSADDSGSPRSLDFTLDMTEANTTVTGTTTKVRSASLMLADEGAQEFNELATGTESGPFYGGEQVGMAQTFYRSTAPTTV